MSQMLGGARFLFALGLLGSVACGGKEPGPLTHGAGGTAAAASPAAEARPEPYTYPAPVSGHYKEVNTGDLILDAMIRQASAQFAIPDAEGWD